ncbi:hypothetical protein NC652_041043 [Populus alba x Populus x berolinensis]|nr:hypothetical protein NC652_041043 [Populus alba x Populus x berolinensis]
MLLFLKRKSTVPTFVDDQLVRGDEISASLLRTIEEAKLSVIVFFCKYYASSKWCLGGEELAKISCNEEEYNGQIVIAGRSLKFIEKIDWRFFGNSACHVFKSQYSGRVIGDNGVYRSRQRLLTVYLCARRGSFYDMKRIFVGKTLGNNLICEEAFFHGCLAKKL